MTNRRFGVEIEFLIERSDGGEYWCENCQEYHEADGGGQSAESIAQYLTECGVPTVSMSYSHEVLDGQWKLVSDSSLDGEGFELVSPPLRWADHRKAVSMACSALQDLGAYIDERCGLHVHHEVSDLDLSTFKRMVEQWAAWQSHTDSLVDPDRADGTWTGPFTEYELDAIERSESLSELSRACGCFDRYRSLNLCAFPQYGTVEIRQHEGTLDASKVLAWIAYGQAVIETARYPWTVSVDALAAAETTLRFLAQLPFLRSLARTHYGLAH